MLFLEKMLEIPPIYRFIPTRNSTNFITFRKNVREHFANILEQRILVEYLQ